MKAIFIILLFLPLIFCLNNGLGKTPPMGWNSWGKYQCNINEQLIKSIINSIVSKGLLKAGYKYINLDDCWQYSRDENGVIVPDTYAFPNGIKPLVDYAHSKGLLFGLFSTAAPRTGQGRPGSKEYEKIDAQTYADWGIDYLKYLGYFGDNISVENSIKIMKEAIEKTKKPIFLSICEWGETTPAKWASKIANSWRITEDLRDNWQDMLEVNDMNNQFAEYAGPGGWNDPDMLQVGGGGMSFEEYKTHFSLWVISKAPLIISCDFSTMSNETLDILSNEEVIAINQDPLGIQGKKIKTIQPKSNYENYTEETDVIISECDGSEKQKWDFRKDGSIRNPGGELCLEIPNCSRRSIQVQTSLCHLGDNTYCEDSENQLWTLKGNGTIVSDNVKKCLTNRGSFTPIVKTDFCEVQANNKWQYNEDDKTLKAGGKCLTRASENDLLEVWVGNLTNNSYAVILLNRGRKNSTMVARWSEIGIQSRYANVRDLWKKKELGVFTDYFEVIVPPHSSYFLKIKPELSYNSYTSPFTIFKYSIISFIIILITVFLLRKIQCYF